MLNDKIDRLKSTKACPSPQKEKGQENTWTAFKQELDIQKQEVRSTLAQTNVGIEQGPECSGQLPRQGDRLFEKITRSRLHPVPADRE